MYTPNILPPCTTTTQAWVLVTVQDGRLMLNVNLPLRWTLATIGAIATATGYPVVVEVVTKLLRTG